MDPQINIDGGLFHKPCAKCADCNCQLTLSNFVKNDTGDETLLLCKTHHLKRFHEQGSYIGADKYKVKSERDMHALTKIASFSEEGPNKGLNEDEQKVKSGSVKDMVASTSAQAQTATSPKAEAEGDGKPPAGTIKEIQRRLSMSKEPTGADKAPAKTLAELVPDMEVEVEAEAE